MLLTSVAIAIAAAGVAWCTVRAYGSTSPQRVAWPYCVHGIVASSLAVAVLMGGGIGPVPCGLVLGLCSYALVAEYLSVGHSRFLGPSSFLAAEAAASATACLVLWTILERMLDDAGVL